MRIGNREFDTEHNVYIMGILNVTPDSFSDGGRFTDLDAALFQTEKMIAEGAAIIDIGGESTKPGADFVSAVEEADRVLPVIRAVKERFDVPISLDTYKAEVAAQGLENGADVINDIWGLRYDERMADVIAANPAAACILCANARPVSEKVATESAKTAVADKADWETGHQREVTAGRIDMAAYYLQESVSIARSAGIRSDRIIVDPAIGFGWGAEADLEIICALEQLRALPYPVMLAASRKSVIGRVLGNDAAARLTGTLALTAIGVMKGCSFIRAHDVRENLQAAKMALAVRESGR